MTRVNLIGVGGCGTNLVKKTYRALKAINMDVTTIRLYSSDDSNDGFTWDVSKRFTKSGTRENLVGSGGDRRANIQHYVNGVNEFMNSEAYGKIVGAKDGKVVNIIFHSANKGTGSSAGLVLSSAMLKEDIPSFSIVIVSDEDELSITNSVNTLRSIEGMANNSRANPLIYVGNNAKGIENVDEDVIDVVKKMSIMGTGLIEELDEADYNSFIDIRKYSGFKIPPTTLTLRVSTIDKYGNPKITLGENENIIVARRIANTKESLSSLPKVLCKHAPSGYVAREESMEVYPNNTILASTTGLQDVIDELELSFTVQAKKLTIKAVTSNLNNIIEENSVEKETVIVEELNKPVEDTKVENDDDGWTSGFIL